MIDLIENETISNKNRSLLFFFWFHPPYVQFLGRHSSKSIDKKKLILIMKIIHNIYYNIDYLINERDGKKKRFFFFDWRDVEVNSVVSEKQ